MGRNPPPGPPNPPKWPPPNPPKFIPRALLSPAAPNISKPIAIQPAAAAANVLITLRLHKHDGWRGKTAPEQWFQGWGLVLGLSVAPGLLRR